MLLKYRYKQQRTKTWKQTFFSFLPPTCPNIQPRFFFFLLITIMKTVEMGWHFGTLTTFQPINSIPGSDEEKRLPFCSPPPPPSLSLSPLLPLPGFHSFCLSLQPNTLSTMLGQGLLRGKNNTQRQTGDRMGD